MKVSVSPKTFVSFIPIDSTEIHLVRPVRNSMISSILRKCNGLKKISLSNSCFNRLPLKAKKLLKGNVIEFEIDSRKGRALSIGLEKVREIFELSKDGLPLREIERITSVPKSTVHYLLKYADRGKIKKGNAILYLK